MCDRWFTLLDRTFPLLESGRGLPGHVPACIWSKYGLSRR
uniref:Uncharacterized protein n=1 Tax=Siphoviridae sp. ctoiW10 TaxID=2827592 RepID=A0A8S5LPL4_9CAUD|nr:MAG TPA: hypothetical protein [Siphoviridae sp. ctoiW10]